MKTPSPRATRGVARRSQRRDLGALFALLCVFFAGIAAAAGYAGARGEAPAVAWAVAIAAAAIAFWLASLATAGLRRPRAD